MMNTKVRQLPKSPAEPNGRIISITTAWSALVEKEIQSWSPADLVCVDYDLLGEDIVLAWVVEYRRNERHYREHIFPGLIVVGTRAERPSVKLDELGVMFYEYSSEHPDFTSVIQHLADKRTALYRKFDRDGRGFFAARFG